MSSENVQQNNEHQSQRKLAAIMFTDIKDFSKKMQENETATMRLLETHNGMLNNNLEAIRNFRKAISIDSTYGDAWKNLGIFFEKISSFDSAIVSYTKALQCNPIDYDARVSLCGIYLVQEQFRQAESLMISGIHLEPSNFKFRYPLGISLFHEGKKKEAMSAWNEGLQKALVESERNPNLSEHKLSISLFNARLGKRNEALWRGKQAFALDSTNSDVVIGLAHLYAILEQKNDMLYWFNRAKTMAPDFDEAYLRTAFDFEQYRNDSELLTIARK